MASSTRLALASDERTKLAELRSTLERAAAKLEAEPLDSAATQRLERQIRAEEEQRFASILSGTLAERDAKLIRLESDATERAKLLDESTQRADELERECAELTRLLDESTARGDALERECVELRNELDIERQAAMEEHYVEIFREGEPIVLVGPGWYGVETIAGGAPFRWVANVARLNVAQLTRAPYALVMDVEPGTAVGNKPFDLAAYEDESKVGGAPVDGRCEIEIALAAAPHPLVRELTLRVENAAQPIPAPGDARVMSYRVFQMRVERRPADVVHPAFAIGKGWYALESFSGETFRWAGSEALIETAGTRKGGTLVLEIEPGPGVGSGPFVLKAMVDNKPPIAISIEGRQRIEIPYARPGETIVLRPEGGGRRVASDPRVLNFRAFSATE